ncbi:MULTISPECIES: RodZ domain-containing protein [Glaesserella]|uniref:DUF4115 domain-containing protein n=1 Tax=Glaesserella australis TaxID=2094024 RepID=A0A328BXS8_9PAST|nr:MULTISPECIES: RodZ domain-containing protein [Glaesserella]AUI66146.1 helix-turn-helix domain-containing protein [Glaesserella sp. 15-184]RAL19168.1 DUF4115 domain-containing protein [Glaesserella australis]
MTDTTLSLGQQLKHAREALNLTIDDVAQKTNLKKNHIDSLENDIFILQNVPPAFVRGYVRNYVRFLRLPEELIGTVNYGEVTIPKEVKKAAPIPVKNQKSQTRWVKGLTWLVLLGAVGMTLAWWWQEHQKDQASRDQLIVNTAETQVTETTKPAENSVALNVSTTPTTQTNETVSPTVAQTTATTTEISATPVVETTVSQSVEPVKTEEVKVEAPATPVVETQAQVEQPVNVLQQTATTETNTTETQAEQPQVAINEELRIEITGSESWITVRGAKNKRLAEKLYKSGEVLSFNDNEQYRLTIGAPANVKIYYKGQLVPLKVDGRVARFKLPLAN